MEMIKIITGFQEHADILYAMLQQKTHVISHHAMPSYEDHIDFIRNNPYRTWYLVKSNDRYVGHVYLLDQNNTMGLVFNNPKQEEVKFAILKKATLLYDTDLDAGVAEYRKKVGDRNKRVSERKAPKD